MNNRNVFLDTEAFVRGNFNFSSYMFSQLKKFSSSGRISMYLTTTTVKEVEKKIVENVEAGNRLIGKFRKDARALRNSAIPMIVAMFDKFDTAAVQEELIAQFHNFLNEVKCGVIKADGIDLDKILADYHAGRPPFGKGRKKHEFPDAFALAALEKWCQSSEQTMYVVSEDLDMISFCEDHRSLESIRKIQELLQIIADEDENLSATAHEIVEKYIGHIKSQIEEKFPRIGFYLEDQDGEVEDVEVSSVDVTESFLVGFEDNTMTLELSASVDFTAEARYEDYVNGMYDSESGEYIVWDTVETSVENTAIVPVHLEFGFDKSKPDTSGVKSITLDIYADDVAVQIDEY